MNAKDKEDWVVARFGRGTFVDPVAFYDALHGGRDGRIAETLRDLISRHSDETGYVADVDDLLDDMRLLADTLEGK